MSSPRKKLSPTLPFLAPHECHTVTQQRWRKRISPALPKLSEPGAGYRGSIHLHCHNLGCAYGEGMPMPEGTVLMEPGCCLWSYGPCVIFSFYFSPGQENTAALQHSVCAAQPRWEGPVGLCPAGKKISCISDTRCISELHPGVLHLHSSTHAATKITAIPVHQLGQHIFPPVASLGL